MLVWLCPAGGLLDGHKEDENALLVWKDAGSVVGGR
jgi:hypothetical protein